MDYIFTSPDMQHKDTMKNAFTESIEIDMNIPKCQNYENLLYREYNTIIFPHIENHYDESY